MRVRLKIAVLIAAIVMGIAAYAQNGDRIEFSADRTSTEFLEGGVVKRYEGNVVARSGDMELRSEEAVYDSRIEETRLWGSTSLKDSVRTIWADTLIYYNRQREAFARGHVHGIERARSFNAGWVRYRRMEHLLEGFGGVTVKDDSIRSSVTGLSMAFNDSTRDGLIIGMPSVVREDDKGSIITLTSADTVRVLNDKRTARVWNDVTVKKDSMIAHSASAFYEDTPEIITLFGLPVIRYIMHGTGDEDKTPIRIASEVTGDTVYVFLKKRELTGVQVSGNAVASTVATDSTGGIYYRSVLESRRMRLDMEGNQVTQVTAVGVANSYYMHAPTRNEKKMFANVARGDTIRFIFKDGRISDMRIRGMGGEDAVGKYYEYEVAKADSVKKKEAEPKGKKGKKK
jgi:hypothetical protein